MASKYQRKYTVPEGFRDCLSDLVREILREQPHDPVDFCHKYFLALETGNEWKYGGKAGRHPVPPPKLTEAELQAM